MNFDQLKALVIQGEGKHIEFKRKVVNAEKIANEIVAFANTKGGYLIIGVDDNGTIPGLKFSEEHAMQLQETTVKVVRPKLSIKPEYIALSAKKSVIVYHIKDSIKKPHFVKLGSEKKYFVRVADRSIQASKEVVEIIRRRKKLKGIKFRFGAQEKLLFEYLEKHPGITLKEYMELVKSNRFLASRNLIRLVLAGVLEVEAREKEDHYILPETFL